MNKKLLPLAIIILLSSFLVPPSATVAQSDGGNGKSSKWSRGAADTTESVRNEVKAMGANLLVADNVARYAEFSDQGFRFVPKMRAEAMPEMALSFRLKTIHSGEVSYVDEADQAGSSPMRKGNEVNYARSSGITEVYKALDAGIEQLFILEHNLQPEGEKLLITGQVTTALKASSPTLRTSGGITFYANQVPMLHYSGATVIDAKGRELEAELELNGDQLTIVVDSAWLQQASYPVTVDPFLGSIIPLVSVGSRRSSPAIASDTVNNRFLMVWEQLVGTDVEIMGLFLDTSGKPAACRTEAFNISTNPTREDLSPALTFDPSSRRFLVVWEEKGSTIPQSSTADYNIKGRFVGAPNGCAVLSPAGGALTVAGLATAAERAPSVAVGAVGRGPNRFLVAYGNVTPGVADARLFGQLVNQDGSACGGAILIGASSGVDFRSRSVVAFGEPELAEFFSIVYRSPDRMIKMARIEPTCGSSVLAELIIDRFAADGPADPNGPPTDARPALNNNRYGHRWVVNWVGYVARLGAVLRWQELAPVSAGAQSNFTTLLGPFRYVRGLSSINSSQTRDVVVALATGTSSTAGFDLLVFHIHYAVEYFSTTFQRDTLPGGPNDLNPVVVASPLDADYFAIWEREMANGAVDIVGRVYVP